MFSGWWKSSIHPRYTTFTIPQPKQKANVIKDNNVFITGVVNNFWINLSFGGNCPPTPPKSHHFALSEKYVLMLA